MNRCAQAVYHSASHQPDEPHPGSGVRLRPDLALKWVEPSDPQISYGEPSPFSSLDRALLRSSLGLVERPPTRSRSSYEARLEDDGWTPPPPRTPRNRGPEVAAPRERSAPSFRWKAQLPWLAEAAAVLALACAAFFRIPSLHQAPADPLEVDADFSWTEARANVTWEAELARAVPRPSDVLTIVAWADLPPVP